MQQDAAALRRHGTADRGVAIANGDSGLTSNDMAAHIHCCAPLGTNVGVATTVPAFPGFPLGVTSGSYSSAVFDLTQPTIYNPAFVTMEGGLFPAEAALIAGIENGMTYLNIHTVNFPGGEIRSQLFPTPEPASLVLLGFGLAGLAAWRRIKHSYGRCKLDHGQTLTEL